jgi:hypothetical protein
MAEVLRPSSKEAKPDRSLFSTDATQSPFSPSPKSRVRKEVYRIKTNSIFKLGLCVRDVIFLPN